MVRDDARADATTDRSRLYHLYGDDEVKDDLNRKAQRHEPLPDLVVNGYHLLGHDWDETRRKWEEQGHPTRPVLITVTNRTETAARIKHAFDKGKVRIDALRDPERTLHIDSKVLGEAEASGEPLALVDGAAADGAGTGDDDAAAPKLRWLMAYRTLRASATSIWTRWCESSARSASFSRRPAISTIRCSPAGAAEGRSCWRSSSASLTR